MIDFEAWEAHDDFHQRRDYPGLIAYCKKEVAHSPNDLHAAERLIHAYFLNKDYEEVIRLTAPILHKSPDICGFQHQLLDALFASGKTEHDFQWVTAPKILQLGPEVSDACYQFLRPKRKPRALYELYNELGHEGYLRFTEEDLLKHLQLDPRFVIEGNDRIDSRISVQRKARS